MASTAGRAVRVLAGVALVVAGGVLGRGWRALTVVGLVQLAGGSLDTSQFNVLIGQLPSGKAVRTA